MVAPTLASITGVCDGADCGGTLTVGPEVTSTPNVLRNLAICGRCGTVYALTTTLRRATTANRAVWSGNYGADQ